MSCWQLSPRPSAIETDWRNTGVLASSVTASWSAVKETHTHTHTQREREREREHQDTHANSRAGRALTDSRIRAEL